MNLRPILATAAALAVCAASLATATGTADAASKKFSGVSAPKISDTTPKVGQKLTAKPDTKTKPAATSRTYQWYRGSAKISGATQSTYTLTSSDKGKTIKVKVCYVKAGYATKCVTSKATKKAAAKTSSSSPSSSSAYFKNCTAVRAAGADPIRRGDPGYGSHLDRDGDGVGCE
jgi:hypothetical protein